MAVRTCVVDLARAGIDGFEELIDLLVGHLLAEVCEDVLELTDTDKTCHVLVEDLETTAVLLRLAGVAEAPGAVQYPLEGLEVDCRKRKEKMTALASPYASFCRV